jgi:lysine/ornithine N-monooxygenase
MYKKMLLGGLIKGTVGKVIKAAYKEYIKQGGRKTADIVKKGHNSNVTRTQAKADVKYGLRRKMGSEKTLTSIQLDNLKNKTGFHNKDARNLLKKRKQLLTETINKLK